jgi:hypothetical protein
VSLHTFSFFLILIIIMILVAESAVPVIVSVVFFVADVRRVIPLSGRHESDTSGT